MSKFESLPEPCPDARLAKIEGIPEQAQPPRAAPPRSAVTTPEQIVAAAHLYLHAHDDGDPRAVPVIVSAPPPARHHNLFVAWGRLGSPDASGFLTSTGRFVTRREAWVIAMAACQPMIPRDGQGGLLFSEDLW